MFMNVREMEEDESSNSEKSVVVPIQDLNMIVEANSSEEAY